MEFEREYKSMISKFLSAKANFKNIEYLESFRAEDDSKTNFIINPKEDNIELIELSANDYNLEIEEKMQTFSQGDQKKKIFSSIMSNNIIFNNENGKMMNYEMNQLSNTKGNEEKIRKRNN